MNPQQYQYYSESIRYCDKLLGQLEQDKDKIRRCFKGEPLKAYLSAVEEAEKKTRQVKSALQSLQAMQPQ